MTGMLVSVVIVGNVLGVAMVIAQRQTDRGAK